jgi:hypothetical protein
MAPVWPKVPAKRLSFLNRNETFRFVEEQRSTAPLLPARRENLAKYGSAIK